MQSGGPEDEVYEKKKDSVRRTIVSSHVLLEVLKRSEGKLECDILNDSFSTI